MIRPSVSKTPRFKVNLLHMWTLVMMVMAIPLHCAILRDDQGYFINGDLSVNGMRLMSLNILHVISQARWW